ncbi:Hypothetical_protein [Hexamita inflata]|uniref:Hypothetical_protein n=1 Tax=Hexamita inflata TaxID=28002 RepID=A0ABP1HFU9_9EUKA
MGEFCLVYLQTLLLLCIYIGWITQAQMLAVLIWNRHALFMQELTLARMLLLLALILDVVVSIKFNAGYVGIPQLIALLTLIPKIKSDFALLNASKIGIILDILLIAYCGDHSIMTIFILSNQFYTFVYINISSQYLIASPFYIITASSLLGMKSIRLLIISCGISCHALFTLSTNSFQDVHPSGNMLAFNKFQQCSIQDLGSGSQLGRDRELFYSPQNRHACTYLYVQGHCLVGTLTHIF